VGVPTAYFFDHVEPETNAALRRALAVLKELGVELVEANVPNAGLCGPTSSTILNSEASAFHEKRLKQSADLLDPLVRERLESGTFIRPLTTLRLCDSARF
jgi:aspartyl-tRNA(Asn)/glutamyl-tRNA(Gln) amidotransferase subunit A